MFILPGTAYDPFAGWRQGHKNSRVDGTVETVRVMGRGGGGRGGCVQTLLPAPLIATVMTEVISRSAYPFNDVTRVYLYIRRRRRTSHGGDISVLPETRTSVTRPPYARTLKPAVVPRRQQRSSAAPTAVSSRLNSH